MSAVKCGVCMRQADIVRRDGEARCSRHADIGRRLGEPLAAEPNLAAASTRELLEELRGRGEMAELVGPTHWSGSILAQGVFDLLDELPDTLLDYRTVEGQ